MPTRKILVLSAVLAFLAGVAFFVQGPGKRHQAGEAARLFPDFDSLQVRTVALAGDGEPLSLSRGEGGGWSVDSGGKSFPADGEAVGRALEKLKEARIQSVASTNVEKRALFGVVEPEGLSVRLEDASGAVAVEFVVGRQGPDPFSGYLLRGDGEDVLIVSPSLRGSFARGVAGWRDRKIVKVGRDEVTAVVIRDGDEELRLARGEGGEWTVQGRPVDRQAVEDYLDRVVTLKASDFAAEEELPQTGLDEPAAAITLTAGEEAHALFLGASKEETRQRYLRRGAGGTVYLVSQYTTDSLLKKETDFPPPSSPEADATTEP